ncbi:DUF3320 domain-containing protein [Pseudonocardia kongjuensis]|uniref:DUF3320 domain-containing protein n=1 Tax=Pseudonocardia kongjuensis TaxID=102227 RepID=A0ABN1XMY8_9PSEU
MDQVLDTVPTIALDVRPVLSYAMAHNGIPVVSRLVVDGIDRAVPGARITLEVADATGPIGQPREIVLDLEAGVPAILADVRLTLDPEAMLQVEERRPGYVRVRLECAGRLCAERSAPVLLLAAQQWQADPPGLALEMLAAHVMPNHPAVADLMREASEILERATGRPSLEGYQSGPERVDEIVAAVTRAMQDRRIAYAEPPASWADDGQKVRTPGDVLDGRIGTCLDTAVVLAAALEYAGVHPLLWVVRGHAFVGYWREELSLAAAAESDAAGVANEVDRGMIELVETTLLTRSPEPATFGQMTRQARAHLSGDLSHVLGIVDVRQARRDRVLPLPARVRDADGAVRVTTYTPQAPSCARAAPVPVADAGEPRRPRSGTEPARVTRWKNALLDLSLRNRLINFTERAALNVMLPGGGAGALEDLLHQGTAVALRASDEIARVAAERGVRSARELPEPFLDDLLRSDRTVHVDVTAAGYPARLRGLAHKARTIAEETGANNLYLALGTLHWELDGRTLRSPLILVPVVLRPARRGGRYQLTLDESGSSTPNYCLIEKLRRTHGLTVPGLSEPAEDGAGIDLDAAFDATREAIAARGLNFRVEPTADLAILQFAKFRLWKDLDDSWAAFAGNPLVAHLLHSPTEQFVDPVADPGPHDLDGLDEQCPVVADASQLRAVADAVAGRTFVLEGPPGTGKSQTITNLLAHAMVQGRRVLFVAEKRAALDVVQKRLDAVGLGALSLDLHDRGSKPVAVRQQIAAALDHVVPVDVTEHDARREELRAARRALTRYAYRMAERNAAGFSLHEARSAELAHGDVAAIGVPESVVAGNTRSGTADMLRTLFARLPELTDAARLRGARPWSFVDTAVGVDTRVVARAVARLDAAIPRLPVRWRPALDSAVTAGELELLVRLQRLRAPVPVLDEVRSRRWSGAVERALAELDRFRSEEHPALASFGPQALDLPLGELDGAARAAAASSIFGRRRRLIAVRERLAPALRAGAAIPPKQVPAAVAALVALRERADGLAAGLAAIPGIVPPQRWNPFDDAVRSAIGVRVEQLRWAAAVVDPAVSQGMRPGYVEPLRQALAAGGELDPAPVAEVAAAISDVVAACATTPEALQRWAGAEGLVPRWQAAAPARGPVAPDLPGLRPWLDLIGHLEPLRSLLPDVRAAVLADRLDPDDARRAFELGLARASVRERLDGTELGRFDPVAHDRAIARFGRTSMAVREHLGTLLPHRTMARREFDTGATSGRIGALRRALGAKRGGMKIRELMSTYGDLISRVLPCVLVSPDSLARFFPAVADQFDIVVFDEASQVRVADAVGAMGRARSVVVVGDSKQMPPTSFADVGGPDDPADGADSAGIVDDEESILTECVQARVPAQRLGWHYRSQDEALIAFSNRHYYDGALSSFPAPERGTGAVSLVRVDGEFHRSGRGPLLRTNPVEARAVVDEILRRFAASPDALPSLGVVTFNQQQRALVEGLLRDLDDPRIAEALEHPEGLFVKNLENVQGDERDVVLFSTAFSVNERGVLPLNFGPLNRAGGERRLNVAVTRARRQVVVFTSFDPSQMRTEDTSSVGVRHLRSYLELAAHGPSALPRDRDRRAVADRHRDEIAERLRDRGLAVRTGVGLSDFVIDLVLTDPQAVPGPRAPRCCSTVRDGRGGSPRGTGTTCRWRSCTGCWAGRGWSGSGCRTGCRIRTRCSTAWSARCAGAVLRPALPLVRPPLVRPPLVRPPLVRPPLMTLSQATPPLPAPAVPMPRRRPAWPGSQQPGAQQPGPQQPGTQRPGRARRDPAGAELVPAVPGSGGRRRAPEPEPVIAAAPAVPAAPDRADADRPGAAAEFVPWRPRPLGGRDVLDALPARAAAARVRAALAEVVEAEGPVRADRLASLVANAFDLSKVSESRREQILAHLPRELRTDRAEPVVWPAGIDPGTWTGYRPAGESPSRRVEEIPLRELGNAMAALVVAGAGMARPELHRETLRVFGLLRRTPAAVERLDAALELARRTGRLDVGPDDIVLPAR